MPLRRVDDPQKLKALLSAYLAIGAGLDLDTRLQRIVEQAALLAGARYGALGVVDASGGLVKFVTTGLDPATVEALGDPPVGKGLLGLLVKEPAAIRLADISAHPLSTGFPPGHPPMRTFLGVPVLVRGTAYGNLYLTDKEGGAEFTDEDEELVGEFTAAASVAIENAALHVQVQELALADDRERIARDLHDTVIQRLFAIGLSLQSVIPRLPDTSTVQRVEEAVTNLDETVRQVRTAIFSLEAAPENRKGLRARILATAALAKEELGFEPSTRFSGALDSQLDDEHAESLLASLQEVLRNIARHARATRASIDVALDGGHLIMEVSDNGVGLPPEGSARVGRGVTGIVGLATRLGGSCVVRNARPGGTVVIWRVPV